MGRMKVSKYMPQAMQDAGTAMHQAANRFAIEAPKCWSDWATWKPALGVLSEVMSACVGCHAGYCRLK